MDHMEVYNKTKDNYKYKGLCFTASLTVTLIYLRSLGVLTDGDPDDYPGL
jgi:hypothetical protein